VRDADIDELAAADVDELRERFLASTARFADALERMPDHAWEGDFARTPGGVRFRLAAVPRMRQVEVEVHHADLDAGYGPEDWSAEFLDPLLGRLVADRAKETSFVLRLPDREVTVGDGGSTVVAGSAARAAWWLLGRGHGEGLRCAEGLPRLGPWR
jgi:maleylpyruvate isomerase